MPQPLVFRRRVGRELGEARAWYDEQRPVLGEEFLAAVDRSFEAIERFPEMFAKVHGDVRRAIVSRFPFAVFYRVEASRIVVLAVLHTARDPKSWPQPRGKAR
jgi:plasmid stabilization system protein ParE